MSDSYEEARRQQEESSHLRYDEIVRQQLQDEIARIDRVAAAQNVYSSDQIEAVQPVAANLDPYMPEYRREEGSWQNSNYEDELRRRADDDRLYEQQRADREAQRLSDDQRRAEEQLQQQRDYDRRRENDLNEARVATQIDEVRRIDEFRREDEVRRRQDEDRRRDSEVADILAEQARRDRDFFEAQAEQRRNEDERSAAQLSARLLEEARDAVARDDAAATARVAEAQRQAQADAMFRDIAQRDASDAVERNYRQTQEYALAYQQNFAQTQALNALWQQAASSARQFDAARDNFWKLVNHSADQNAEYVRSMLQAADYQIRQGSQAPLLNLSTGAKNSNLDYADRVLSIDHANAQSRAADQALDAANLRFMSGRDNSSRGNRFNADDDPIAGYRWRRT